MAEELQSFKVAEVARRLRVDPRTIYRVIASGDLHAVRVGRVWRVPADALEAYLDGDFAEPHSDAQAGA
jgi:excisionase family DNA binding protein